MANRTIRTEQNRANFLAALRETGRITTAAQIVGHSRNTLYEWKLDDPDFALEWEAAFTQAADSLEDEAVRRAMSGSDLLLIFLLKGLKPDRYREQRHLTIEQRLSVDVRGMSVADIRTRLAELRAEQDGSPAGAPEGPVIDGTALVPRAMDSQ